MRIGLVGYRGSGKSTLFEWLTGCDADPSLSHTGQSAQATIAEPRLEPLQRIYQAKKASPPSLEIVDTPGLERTHEGNAARLAAIREADCLVLVVGAFDGSDPLRDYRSFEEDLLLADMEIVSGRIQRVEAALTKPLPRSEREQLVEEHAALQSVLEAMEAGNPLRQAEMTAQQRRATRSFRLLTEKPRMVVLNTSDTSEVPEAFASAVPPHLPVVAVPVALERELDELEPEERRQFEESYHLERVGHDQVLRMLMDAAGQIVFFTASSKEVRCWLIPKGATALEAAGLIHSDMARGFIRAEVMNVNDLIRLGSHREVKAQHLLRQEPKDYVVQNGDILLIRFST